MKTELLIDQALINLTQAIEYLHAKREDILYLDESYIENLVIELYRLSGSLDALAENLDS